MAVQLTTENAIALVTIDRQEAMNALDVTTVQELRDVLAGLAADPAVRCVILTGAGERAFIGGADIKYMAEVDAGQAAEFAELGHHVGDLLETMPKPTIAAINGYALGGGCELALACDIRYASANAKLGQPEVNYGLVPGWGGTQRLARATTLGFAKELVLTGRLVDADEAYSSWPRRRHPRPRTRQGLRDGACSSRRRGRRHSRRRRRSSTALSAATTTRTCGRSPPPSTEALLGAEAREGLAAFVEKRPPRFALDD